MARDQYGDTRKRGRIGRRRNRATVTQHPGTEVDEHGQPTYTEPGDYDTIVSNWPVEIITTGGSEVLQGRQITAATTHVIFGGFEGGSSITSDMKITIDGAEYDVIAAYDPDGDRKEIRVEAKRNL